MATALENEVRLSDVIKAFHEMEELLGEDPSTPIQKFIESMICGKSGHEVVVVVIDSNSEEYWTRELEGNVRESLRTSRTQLEVERK